MKELRQRKLQDIREFMLQEKGVNFKHSHIGNSHEIFIPFENITTKTERVALTNRKWLIATVIFLVAFLISLLSRIIGSDVETFAEVIWGGLTLATYLMYWRSKNEYVIVRGSEENLPFYKNIPNLNTVDEFIQDIFKTRKEYLKIKYARVDTDYSPQENIGRFRWLKDNEIITHVEYDELKRTIENMVQGSEQEKERSTSPSILN